jgi:erythromycin esterase-like protein
MDSSTSSDVSLRTLDQVAHPVTGEGADFDALLELVGERHIVMIGEASHGTHEFYRERARLTERLIDELGFNAVTIEGDWPDAYRVNRYVTSASDTTDADEALGGFERFPHWMWRNRDVLTFIQWLRARNDAFADWENKVHFYGLDLYSLRSSIESVVTYLDAVDPGAAARARQRYACFDHVAREGQVYGYALARGAADPCEDQVVEQLLELRQQGDAYLRRDGLMAEDEQFCAEQNALLVHDAEEYYRQMYRAEISSWNLRDTHMANTLDAILHHLSSPQRQAKIVVWAHNSHVGDARATEMGERGEYNIGQLARQRYARDTMLIGFSTFSGQVTAASQWGEATERKRVRPARHDSHEALLHQASLDDFWVATRDLTRDATLTQDRLERAIGVIYRPESERQSHYFRANLVSQFDAVIHIDHTSALEPLERTALWDTGEPAETYPSGL